MLCALLSIAASAQGGNTGYGDSLQSQVQSLASRVLQLEGLHDKCNIYINFNGAATVANDSTGWSGYFRNKHLRIEIKGQVTPNFYYRFRHRLDKLNERAGIDHFSRATDIMMIGYKVTDRFTVECGKMIQYLGGFEYDANPIYVYEFSELTDLIDFANTGVALKYDLTPSQELVVNITNSMGDRLFRSYPGTQQQGLRETAFPINAVLNWNGSFANHRFETRCSAGVSKLAKGVDVLQVILGQKINLPTFSMYADYSYEKAGIDRMGLVSSDFHPLLPHDKPYLENTQYHAVVSRADWQTSPRWSLFGKCALEWCNVRDMPDLGRRHCAAVAGIEYKPLPHHDLRYYLCLSRHWRHYTTAASSSSNTDSKVEVGVICRLKVL